MNPTPWCDRMTLPTVAVLFADPRGVYANLPGVDLWDEARDARTYAGPHPVVAHPPCGRWCVLAGLVEARYGYKRGEDDGCFESALKSVRRFGGILEHPAYSLAWPAFGLPRPHRRGAWQRGLCGGWACHVEQGRYGHRARKATWLYAFGTELQRMPWGVTDNWPTLWRMDGYRDRPLSRCPIHEPENMRRMSKKEASATPTAFRDVLLQIARSARRPK